MDFTLQKRCVRLEWCCSVVRSRLGPMWTTRRWWGTPSNKSVTTTPTKVRRRSGKKQRALRFRVPPTHISLFCLLLLRLWLQDVQRAGGSGAAEPWHCSGCPRWQEGGGHWSWRPGKKPNVPLSCAQQRSMETRGGHDADATCPFSAGSDVRLRHRWNRGVHAAHHRLSPQTQCKDGRTQTQRHHPLAASWL